MLLDDIDLDGSGTIDFVEFLGLMASRLKPKRDGQRLYIKVPY